MNLKTIILGFIIITSTACQSNLLKNALNGTSEKVAEDAVVTTMSMTQSGGEEAAHVAAIFLILLSINLNCIYFSHLGNNCIK